jgi:CheY-like chemotaxis protein/signal recognition particle receptor subunit beta
MVLFNHATKEVTAKLVYYGPALSGKTTNLQWIHEHVSFKSKGKLLSLATQADRTLYFDFLPVELGTIRGHRTRIQMYTVPGQVFYDATRRMVLKGADAVVFVADCQEALLDANLESLESLRRNLLANDLDPAMPMVIQYNKRDLPGALPLATLNAKINLRNVPHFAAVAVKGVGVEDTLRGVTRLLFKTLSDFYGTEAVPKAQLPTAPAPAAPALITASPVSESAPAAGAPPKVTKAPAFPAPPTPAAFPTPAAVPAARPASAPSPPKAEALSPAPPTNAVRAAPAPFAASPVSDPAPAESAPPKVTMAPAMPAPPPPAAPPTPAAVPEAFPTPPETSPETSAPEAPTARRRRSEDAPPPPSAGLREEQWVYLMDKRQSAPLDLDDLIDLVLTSLPEDTKVWRPGLRDWTAANRVPEIAEQIPPPLPFTGAGEEDFPDFDTVPEVLRTALIADEDEGFRKLLALPLAAQGFRIFEAEDGAAAWQLATENRPWLMLADIDLPEVDGFEFCRRVRANSLLSHTPLVFISGSDKFKDRARAQQVGSDDFLSKQTPIRELLIRIQLLLTRYSDLSLKAQAGAVSGLLEGQLEVFGAPGVLQICNQSRLTGIFTARARDPDSSAEKVAVMGFREGEIINATVLDLAGAEAVYAFLAWPNGLFKFVPGDPGTGQPLAQSVEHLLLEGCRLLDESDRDPLAP